MKRLERFIYESLLDKKRENLNKTVLDATYKAQQLYGFECCLVKMINLIVFLKLVKTGWSLFLSIDEKQFN